MKTEYVKGFPLMRPYIDFDNEEFWKAHREEKLVIQQCKHCELIIHRPRPMCPRCLGTEHCWIESAGLGKIYSWTVFRYANAAYPGIKVPYIVVLVDMMEGIRMIANLEGVEPEDIEMGMPVELFFDRVDDDLTLPKFKRQDT